MGDSNIAELTERFDDNKKIIDLYNTLIGDLNEIPVAVQYEEAKIWLKHISEVITQHIVLYESDQTENIRLLENKITSSKKFLDFFKGGELAEPIFDIIEFDDLLNKSGFEISTKVAIKKAIGKANYNLVIKKTLTPDEKNEYINKYRIIYEKKSATYEEYIRKVNDLIKEKNIELKVDEALNQIQYLASHSEIAYKNIQNSVFCILLKKELELYDEFLQEDYDEEFKNQLIETCEKLLTISRKRPPKEDIEEIPHKEPEKFKNPLIDQSEKLISQAEEIIKSEYELLDRIVYKDKETFYRLAAINNGEDSELTLAIIVDSIKQSLSLLKDFLKEYQNTSEIYEQKCKEQILNITEFIETYEIIKKRLEANKDPQKEVANNKYPVLYLTNKDNQAFIINSLENENISKEGRHHLKSILNNLEKGNRQGSEKEYTISNYTVLQIPKGEITLTYILLSSNAILVLFADQSVNNIRKTTKDIINHHAQKINEFMSKTSSKKELNILLDEQAEIRNKLNKYLNESKNKKLK